MTFTLLSVRPREEHLDDPLYPTPTYATNGIREEPMDGGDVVIAPVTNLRLRQRDGDDAAWEEILRASDLYATLHVTDGRVAVACSRYDKGGGWVGGLPAIALNVASKTRAAMRSRGLVMVGHVRYPWLRSVGYTQRTGAGTAEELRIVVQAPGRRALTLDLTLPRTVSAAKVSREVAARAARFRLRHTSIDDAAERASFESLLDPPPLLQQPGTFATYSFPTFYPVSAATGFGRPIPKGGADA